VGGQIAFFFALDPGIFLATALTVDIDAALRLTLPPVFLGILIGPNAFVQIAAQALEFFPALRRRILACDWQGHVSVCELVSGRRPHVGQN
jgi:hypothetical protein